VAGGRVGRAGGISLGRRRRQRADPGQPALSVLVLGRAGGGVVHDPPELNDGFGSLVEERVGRPEAEAGPDRGGVEIGGLAILLDRIDVVGLGEERFSLRAEALHRGERGGLWRSWRRPRLAGGQQKRGADHDPPHR